ncbi:MAG: hypothetical protein EOP47_20655, partial [Sphingobacteriaceae bacterium]
FLTVFILFLFKFSVAQVTYPGGQLPADTPAIFAPGILSDGLANRDFTISPDGNEIYFTLQQQGFLSSTILQVVKVKGKWGKPQVAPFSGKYRDLEASLSADGQTIYFASDRPLSNGLKKKDFDIWKVTKLQNGQWGEPANLGPVVNTANNEFYPSVAKNGNLYFTSEAANGKGKEDIVVCTYSKQGYSTPVSLPEAVNSAKYEFNAFIDPDEQFILFTSFGRDDDIGGGDLYISHKDKNGNWLPAKHLPAPVNTTVIDYCPYVTYDKKHLIFTSSRAGNFFGDGKTKTYEMLQGLLYSAGNGLDDLYWINFNKDW